MKQEKFEKKVAKLQEAAKPELQIAFEKTNKNRFNGYHDPEALEKLCKFLEKAGYIDMNAYRGDKQIYRLRFVKMLEGDSAIPAVNRKADPVAGVKSLSKDELAVFGGYLQQQSGVTPQFFAERLKDGSVEAMLEAIKGFGIRPEGTPSAPRPKADTPLPKAGRRRRKADAPSANGAVA